MTKHELVAAAPIMLDRVMGNDFRSIEAKLEFVKFLYASLDRAADNLDPSTDGDLYRPIADLFGQLEAIRWELQEELDEC